MKIRAYGVHALTALGGALGLYSLILIYNGQLQEALWVLGAAALVDSVDGALARRYDTLGNAPRFDGALMDNIIDFVTWTVAPLLWAYAALNVPGWVLVAVTIASAFGFSNIEAKTSDKFFMGFPSFWNIVVFYLFLLDLSVNVSSFILLFLGLAVFAPVKFIYPSQTRYYKNITLIFGGVYALQLVLLLYLYDESPLYLIYSSFFYPVYYFGLSFYLNLHETETSRS